MRNWKLIVSLIASVLASCAHDKGRPGVASRTFDCYDYWPYVYSAPRDCFYGPSAFYDPAYDYYRRYPAYSAPVARAPVPEPSSVRGRVPLAPRERRPLEDTAPELPVPLPSVPRTLP